MSSKPLHELTFKEYTDLLQCGMMYVYYPECTGSFNRDSINPDEEQRDLFENYDEESK